MNSNVWTGLGACLLLASMAGLAQGQTPWEDDIETYPNGSDIVGQGGWEKWDNAVSGTSLVTDQRARTGAQSLRVGTDGTLVSDTVHPFSGFTSGKWLFSTYMYIPGDGQVDELFGSTNFLMLSDYNAGGPYFWTVWIVFDATMDQWSCYGGTGGTPTATGTIDFYDRWVKIEVLIDLDNDETSVSVDGTQLVPTYSWTGGWNGAGGGPSNIGTIDLFDEADVPTSNVYYDDFRLGEPPTDVAFYCTAKSGLVCGVPSMSATGISSATATSGFSTFASPARQNRSGVFIYTDAGRAAFPFQGGTLCVNPAPLRRSCAVFSGGSSACDGVFTVDWNSFNTGGCGGNPAAFLSVAGTTVNAQTWGRDSVATGSFLSDGAEWVVGP